MNPSKALSQYSSRNWFHLVKVHKTYFRSCSMTWRKSSRILQGRKFWSLQFSSIEQARSAFEPSRFQRCAFNSFGSTDSGTRRTASSLAVSYTLSPKLIVSHTRFRSHWASNGASLWDAAEATRTYSPRAAHLSDKSCLD